MWMLVWWVNLTDLKTYLNYALWDSVHGPGNWSSSGAVLGCLLRWLVVVVGWWWWLVGGGALACSWQTGLMLVAGLKLIT